ncbi:TlpA family protein disulfide reductase [Nakamurella endophytica]|uniref:Alkyl hydroperoxide reductase n=1 Tax=Nakamurella endophytica TaxID=1748367 RepID=A0A917SYK8_9ACTN|nr:TlpA disulfide reductase family protein [Nakamurella endophytica]GGM04035.1 alkyl hydroperoxide reductase [Nakamurella endophytica]
MSAVRAARRAPRAAAALLVSLLAVLSGCTGGGDAASFQFVSPGGRTEFSYAAQDRRPIGELSGPALEGDGTVSVAQFADKVVVLNFWGSWCGPCRAEAQQLQDASTQLAPQGVQFLGLNVKDEKGAGAAFDAAKGVTYPSIFDPFMRTLLSIQGYPASAIPSTIVLDRRHRVAHIWLGAVTRAELVAAVVPIAAEK